MREARIPPLQALMACLFAAFGGWLAWVIAMSYLGADWPLIRAVVRVLVVLAPALVYLRTVEKQPAVESLGLKHRPVAAAAIGLAVGLIISAPAWSAGGALASIHLPKEPAVWLNAIIGSPIAEELLFRGVVFRVLAQRLSWPAALSMSSLLFAAFHLPAWTLLDARPFDAVLLGFGQMAAYGFLFALLFSATRSLWCPLLAHVVNNLIVSAT